MVTKLSKRAALRCKWKVGTVAHACTLAPQWKVDTAGQFQVQGQPGQHCEHGIQDCRASQKWQMIQIELGLFSFFPGTWFPFFPSFVRILAWILIIWKIVTFDHHGRREIQGNTVRVTVEKEIVHRAAKHGKRQKGEQASARIRVRLTSVQGNTGEPHTLRCSSFLWKSTVSFRISVRCHQDWVHSSDTLWATASLREGLHSGFPLLSGNGFVGVFT